MKKFYKFCFCLSLILIMALGPLAEKPVQAFSFNDMSMSERQRVILELTGKLIALQRALDAIKLNNEKINGSSSVTHNLINPGSTVFNSSTFGVISSINKVVVKPANVSPSSLILYSNRNERLHLSVNPIEKRNSEGEQKYVFSVSYYLNNIEEDVQTYSPINYAELQEKFFGDIELPMGERGVDHDFLDDNTRFLIENPVLYQIRKRTNSAGEGPEDLSVEKDCYLDRDKDKFIKVLKLVFKDRFKHGNLDSIVSFVTPTIDGDSSFSNGGCIGNFVGDLYDHD